MLLIKPAVEFNYVGYTHNGFTPKRYPITINTGHHRAGLVLRKIRNRFGKFVNGLYFSNFNETGSEKTWQDLACNEQIEGLGFRDM